LNLGIVIGKKNRMKVKKTVIGFCLLALGFSSKAQKKVTLYYFQDAIHVPECGTSMHAEILVFLKDTTIGIKEKSNVFLIAVNCPDTATFRKARQYEIYVSKSSTGFKESMSPDQIAFIISRRNGFFAGKIRQLE
jgi:hypothetical protein